MDRMIVARRWECEHAQTQVDDVGLVFFLLKDRIWVHNFVSQGATGSAEGLENRIFYLISAYRAGNGPDDSSRAVGVHSA
jgi:hypothetical protein